ncbi:MAG: hypothetical protein AAFY64_02880, partial [Pseudomonadota bacterium]
LCHSRGELSVASRKHRLVSGQWVKIGPAIRQDNWRQMGIMNVVLIYLSKTTALKSRAALGAQVLELASGTMRNISRLQL